MIYDFLSLKNDVNVPSERIAKKLGEKFFWDILTKRAGSGSGARSASTSGSVSQRYGSADPEHWLKQYRMMPSVQDVLPGGNATVRGGGGAGPRAEVDYSLSPGGQQVGARQFRAARPRTLLIHLLLGPHSCQDPPVHLNFCLLALYKKSMRHKA